VWITQPEAAKILGVHPQTVAKMVARGDSLRAGSPVGSDPWTVTRSWHYATRASAKDRRQRRREAGERRTREAAAFMGVFMPAISKRARRGRLPHVEHEGRRWFRRDHLELVKHADLLKLPRARQRST
jgi:hypothetical protein